MASKGAPIVQKLAEVFSQIMLIFVASCFLVTMYKVLSGSIMPRSGHWQSASYNQSEFISSAKYAYIPHDIALPAQQQSINCANCPYSCNMFFISALASLYFFCRRLIENFGDYVSRKFGNFMKRFSK
jgi:hypothetical protein